jgi:phosphoribosyl 1,2-cyclic phosphodiesterase
MLIKFWGVHGSLPRPGPQTLKYGGNTACVEVRCSETLLIFDAGSGIRELGEDLIRRSSSNHSNPIKAHIFFSHLHWDHVQGFPFFGPAFVSGNVFDLYGGTHVDLTLKKIMSYQMAHPCFPITLEHMSALVRFHELEAGQTVQIEDVTVKTYRLNHPGGSLGYRVEQNGKTMVYASDTEHGDEDDLGLINLCQNCDVLIYDGMFTPEQYHGTGGNHSRQSWGHSTWTEAVKLAARANVKKLFLFHHGNPDCIVQQIESQAQEVFSNCNAAYEGLEVQL